jgi:hypothetical protein
MSKAYISDKFYMRQLLMMWWLDLFSAFSIVNRHDQAFILHLYRSMVGQYRRFQLEGGIPISYELRIKELPESDIHNIAPVVGYKEHSRFKGLSRVYFIHEPIFTAAVSLTDNLTTEEILSSPRVDFFSGRTPQRRFKGQTIFRDKNNNPEPQVLQFILKAIQMGTPVCCNIYAIKKHVDSLTKALERVEATYGKGSKEYQKVFGRYLNDKFCYESLLDHAAYLEGDILYFYPVYEVCATGRLIMVGGGLQSASRAMKAAAYMSIPGANIHNWDLVSCHPNLFIQIIEDELKYEPQSLKHYLESGVRKKMAEEAGINESTFKQIILAYINGARIPKSATKNPFTRNTVIELLEEDFGDGQRKIDLALQGLNEITQGVRRDIDPFHEYVMDGWLSKYGISKGRLGKTIKNDVGKSLPIRDASLGEVMSFILQGREQLLVGSVLRRAITEGCKLMCHEHDGFVLEGNLPAGILEAAKKETGIRYASLKEKPFAA